MTVDLGLDHVGLAVRNLGDSSVAYLRLGFQLTAKSMHAGSLEPGGPVVPWGSGNQCAMFQRGYFEILGLVDPSLPSNVKAMLAKYEGLHIVALDTADVNEAYREYVKRGVHVSAPIRLERDAAFGAQGEHVRCARFANVYPDIHAFPDARFIVIEHKTRDVLWQPHYLSHPNGALGLSRVYLVSDRPDERSNQLATLLGPAQSCCGAFRFALRSGELWVCGSQAMRSMVPRACADAFERVGAACIDVDSLERLEAYLGDVGITYELASQIGTEKRSVWVGPLEGTVSPIQFVQA
ncbi:VOC family protein [Pandoraea anhela]|uniref:Glyoxalase-like domain-containing protein n=1 Tax=Pandoraea anhela TaxID=2508295 RepID=A0A5E4YS84_9BURK|nr:VOC family protein [Pandoraea anhela]VVE51744.1 hypothetical protein PAN31108_04745 [Pandoraea anhela]